jgi:hypothetical protein
MMAKVVFGAMLLFWLFGPVVAVIVLAAGGRP